MKEDMLRRAMREMGARGGRARSESLTAEQRTELARKAGKSRLVTLTPEQRSDIAKKAAAVSAKVRAAQAKKT